MRISIPLWNEIYNSNNEKNNIMIMKRENNSQKPPQIRKKKDNDIKNKIKPYDFLNGFRGVVSRHFNSTRELWGFSSVLAISSLTSCLVWFNIGINNCVLSNSIKSALNLNQRNGTQLY